jgi:hypothetical protein
LTIVPSPLHTTNRFHAGNLIVWSDVDIRFFDLTPDRLASELAPSRVDILIQRSGMSS